ncbi:hypothetical protein [Treponema pedis]|uniref:Lipoprotein n=1 Tax=Treponema pedis TaxID=409322 RepID=A0A7S7AVU9_9SPIR|nr:hypothetical protein [Treponema pedis]QOW60019.1 hypothetical protein IFE08_09170 [Treponema pedis]QSI05362.1 hypothetical protein DYQ05_10780 [Treponema pedis]
MKNLKSLLFILFFLSLCSCSKKERLKEVDLPSDSAMNDANRFALIIETYVSLRDKPGEDGIAIAHARRLDIFPVEGLKIVKNKDEQELWINLGTGWIQRESVQLYPSKEKVLKAAEKYRN